MIASKLISFLSVDTFSHMVCNHFIVYYQKQSNVNFAVWWSCLLKNSDCCQLNKLCSLVKYQRKWLSVFPNKQLKADSLGYSHAGVSARYFFFPLVLLECIKGDLESIPLFSSFEYSYFTWQVKHITWLKST